MHMKTQHGNVSLERLGDHIARVVIDKPPYNNVSVELMTDLADVLAEADADKESRVVLLSTTGKAFCAGADLTRRADEIGIAATEAPPETAKGNPLYDQAVRLHASELPIVAAIQGAAVGAGLGLALVADFRIAAPDARFAANFVKLGFHPGFGLTHTLPRLIGQQRAALMFLTGRRIKAEEALSWGLVDQVVYADRLMATAQELAAEIAENAPLAVRSTRLTLRGDLAAAVKAQTDHEFAEQQWQMTTDDFREGVKAVNERRPGKFTGK
jgi:enoyl-CoA hydratase/carnithine racemase